MDALTKLLQFTIEHPYMVLLVFVLGIFTGVALSYSPHFLFLILSRLPRRWGLYRSAMEVSRVICSIGASWTYYRISSDAVILGRIDTCKRFLKLHFDEGQSGEVWLFRSDLRAFWQCDAFEELYRQIVDENKNITWVRILIQKRYIDSIRTEIWDRIFVHLGRLERRNQIVYQFLGEAGRPASIDAEFEKYASDESFIFYTRGTRLHQHEAICVHRRFSLEADHATDLRITLVASREGHLYAKDPLQKFLPNQIAAKFESLFAETTGTWAPLYNLADEKRGIVTNPHTCS